jgi:hypothetical protein
MIKKIFLLILLASFPVAAQQQSKPPIAVYIYGENSEPIRIAERPNPAWRYAERQWELNAFGVPNISYVAPDNPRRTHKKPHRRHKSR